MRSWSRETWFEERCNDAMQEPVKFHSYLDIKYLNDFILYDFFIHNSHCTSVREAWRRVAKAALHLESKSISRHADKVWQNPRVSKGVPGKLKQTRPNQKTNTIRPTQNTTPFNIY